MPRHDQLRISIRAIGAMGIAAMLIAPACDRKPSGKPRSAPASSEYRARSAPSSRGIDDLVKSLDGDEGAARCDAAMDLFARGSSAAKELADRGARPSTSAANPRRLDVVWTLVSCSVPRNARSDRLGIVFAPEVKEADVPNILKRHGLSLLPDTHYDANATPQARVFTGYDAMLAKAHELMAEEPKVRLVSFEQVE